MIIKSPIYCPKCGKFVCYEEDLMYMMLPLGGLTCPYCGAAVMHDYDITYGGKDEVLSRDWA